MNVPQRILLIISGTILLVILVSIGAFHNDPNVDIEKWWESETVIVGRLLIITGLFYYALSRRKKRPTDSN